VTWLVTIPCARCLAPVVVSDWSWYGTACCTGCLRERYRPPTPGAGLPAGVPRGAAWPGRLDLGRLTAELDTVTRPAQPAVVVAARGWQQDDPPVPSGARDLLLALAGQGRWVRDLSYARTVVPGEPFKSGPREGQLRPTKDIHSHVVRAYCRDSGTRAYAGWDNGTVSGAGWFSSRRFQSINVTTLLARVRAGEID